MSAIIKGGERSLLNTFDKIYVLDLHGNSKKKETAHAISRKRGKFK